MTWAQHTHQPLLFLKRDFTKAYDMVEWDFMFRAMRVMGFSHEFVIMVKLLFQDVSASGL